MIIKASNVSLSVICVDCFNCRVITSYDRMVCLVCRLLRAVLSGETNCVASQRVISIASVLRLDDEGTVV
jgi:hypothetical protein